MEKRLCFIPDHIETPSQVETINDDEWRSYCAQTTATIVANQIRLFPSRARLLINAGASLELSSDQWDEISVDLLAAPFRKHRHAICDDSGKLPYAVGELGAVVCVGQALGYCDAAWAIEEFSRVLAPNGVLICDFGNSLSFRHWLRPTYSRMADVIEDAHNGSRKVWVYDPDYIQWALKYSGFAVREIFGTHSWSALSQRLGASRRTSVRLQKMLEWLPQSIRHADVTTIVAIRA